MKKTIQELLTFIDNYMSQTIDGDNFNAEQDFEDEIRAVLEEEGFEVLEKHNVRNIQKMLSEGVGNVEDKIPDIVVDCVESLMFLELKYCNTLTMYENDILKAKRYVDEEKCCAAGVLFLDTNKMAGCGEWKMCAANDNYYYFFGYESLI